MPSIVTRATDLRPVERRVLVVVFDPVFTSCGGKRLSEACGYHDPQELIGGYIRDLAEVSGGYLRYRVEKTLHVESLPRKVDGFSYGEADYLQCWRQSRGWHDPDTADYPDLLRQTGALQSVEAQEVDEVWLWGPPYAGLWESTMVGPGAVFCNSEPVAIPCSRRCVVMGFNYERGVGEMLESFGHRAESLLAHAFGSWREWGGREGHAWDRFTAYDLVAPGASGCGTVHYAPNSRADYDWGNTRQVWSTCDEWQSYPELSARRRLVDCRAWGGGDIRAHHRWWLACLPKAPGETNGIRNNWWSYVA